MIELMFLAPLLTGPLMTPQESHPSGLPPLPSAEELKALPPDGGGEFNRLVFESSPYLLQHARNPVDWWPWGEEAFEEARRRDLPVFLSIGYSTCHWCHVMERESFEDDEVAALMNEHFVCIKVDREERPDVDHVYMTVTQGMTGRGGWPMTVALTPDKKPFFAGTYFPKGGGRGRPGMLQLVPQLSNAWKTDRENVVASAQKATDWLASTTGGSPGKPLGSGILQVAQANLEQNYDARFGGFGTAPKFPSPHQFGFLLRQERRKPGGGALEKTLHTLRQMRLGGIWDHVGFGFHRYSTDQQWLVPHFEKMLYDQALIAIAYVEAWQLDGSSDLQRTASEIFEYVLRDMTAPSGGFYSAEDADSEGEEGLFYLWTREDWDRVAGSEDAELFAGLLRIQAGGNFTDEASGQQSAHNIPHLAKSLADSAPELGLGPQELEQRFEALRKRLFDVREKRIHPLKDDKILTDWNGLMIAALAKGGRAFDEPRFTQAARRAADFALAELRRPDGRLHKRMRLGAAGLDGTLEDYAFLSWGLIELHQACGETRYLKSAVELCELALRHFQDAEQGGFFVSADDTDDLIVRPKEIYDGALPSGNSVMACNLLRLARLTGRNEFEEAAERTLTAFADGVRRAPAAHTQLLQAIDFLVGPGFEAVLVGDAGSEAFGSVRAKLGAQFAPHLVTLIKDSAAADGGAALTELAPFTEGQTMREGLPTLYLCRDFACEAPTSDIDAVLEKLRAAHSFEEPVEKPVEKKGATEQQ